ncbi:hypothetical protein FKW77_007578 [Venturia effusa]|uniref:BTB domain-containing protein n=1 Tax=Venturia effusa TaxID=50376 RepID=A0A517LJD5_9PEZI|nr:hypothetical protein FKW77_007578 [Venturia effusa]
MRTSIDPDGDVLLVVGSDESQMSLQVSSKVLSVASKVFKTMFFGRFKEAVELANSSTPYEIELPDDDPTAMSVLCAILHHAEFTLPISIKMLIQFAVVADKYDTLRACKLTAHSFLATLYSDLVNMTIDNVTEILVIAYYFDDHYNFGRASMVLISQPNGAKKARNLVPDAVQLPGLVLETINQKRDEAEDLLSAGLTAPITKMTSGGSWYGSNDHTSYRSSGGNCKHDVFKVYDYIWELRDLGLWPIRPKEWSLSRVAIILSLFVGRTTVKDGMGVVDGIKASCNACTCNTTADIASLLEGVSANCEPLCLDCIRAGVDQGKGTSCRVEH